MLCKHSWCVSVRLDGKHLAQSVDSCTLVLLSQDMETMHLDAAPADKRYLVDRCHGKVLEGKLNTM